MREQLLSYLPWFVVAVAGVPGVRRISLLGSITTNKLDPKDIDFLVVVDDYLDLEPLARATVPALQSSLGLIGRASRCALEMMSL